MKAFHQQSIEAPALPQISVAKTQHGLFARWETVNGKLTCRWIKNPD